MSRLTGEVAEKDARCPGCGLEVGGWYIGVTAGNKRTWDRPYRRDLGPTGTAFGSGGLTHIQGGERCLRAKVVNQA